MRHRPESCDMARDAQRQFWAGKTVARLHAVVVPSPNLLRLRFHKLLGGGTNDFHCFAHAVLPQSMQVLRCSS